MIERRILAVAKWEQAWEFGEVFWEEGLATPLTRKQINKLNVLQIDFVEEITHRHHFVWNFDDWAFHDIIPAHHCRMWSGIVKHKEVTRPFVDFFLRKGMWKVG